MIKKGICTLLFAFIFSITHLFGQEVGNATFYSDKLHGHLMANGEKYNKDSLTCAHRTLPFGTLIRVYAPKTQREVIVKVTDRGPRSHRFIIDLSYQAAKELGIQKFGICPVQIEVLQSKNNNQ